MSNSAALLAASGAYKEGNVAIPNYTEVFHGPTVSAWLNNGTDPATLLIGIRGTADLRDVATDVQLTMGKLTATARYNADAQTVQQLLQRYPKAKVFLAGHSLGGAIENQLVRQFPRITHATEFNPAAQPYDVLFPNTSKVDRWYIAADALYRTVGQLMRGAKVLQPTTPNPGILAAHGLTQFTGRVGAGGMGTEGEEEAGGGPTRKRGRPSLPPERARIAPSVRSQIRLAHRKLSERALKAL